MFFFLVIIFTSVNFVNSISQVVNDLDLKSGNDIGASTYLQNELDVETNQNSLILSKNVVTADADILQNSAIGTDSLQNGLTSETDPSQNTFTLGTDSSQHEFIAETDSDTSGIPKPECASTAPMDNGLNENTRILPRGEFCPAEVPPPIRPIRPPQRERPAPPILNPKPPPRPKPAGVIEKPVRRPRDPADDENPCAAATKVRQTLVTCQGPEIAYSEMDESNTAFVIGCVLGKSFKLVSLAGSRH